MEIRDFRDFRLMELQKLLDKIKKEYYRDDNHLDNLLMLWAMNGIGSKYDIMATSRRLYDRANQNIKTIELFFSYYKEELSFQDEVVLETIKKQANLLYEAKLNKMNTIKKLIPLVTPKIQLKK